jgi:hypothetical protein
MTAGTLSEIFSKDVYLDSVRDKLTESTNRISELKDEEEDKKFALEKQREMQEILRASLAFELAESEATLEKS